MCSLCEETSLSCRGPANHNAVALILPHKSLISFLGGAIGSDIYNDRAGIHCRTHHRRRQGARRAEGSGQRLLRPARRVHDGAALERARHAVRRQRGHAGRRRLAEGHAHRDHPRVDAARFRASRRTSRSSPPRRRRSRTCSASTSARRWSNRPIRSGPTTPTIENMTTTYTRALAEMVPVFFPDDPVPADAGRNAAVPGLRRDDQADRVRDGQDLRIGNDGADRLHGGRWPTAGSRRRRT